MHMSLNRIGVVMVSIIPSSAVDRGFEPRSGQTKDNKSGICCFSVMHAALRYYVRHCVIGLFDAKCAIFQLSHGENKLHSMRS
jgi:hypothetical protein